VTHMVIFRSPEGKPGYHQSDGLDEAMRFAEMLRNQEQVTDARIFRMDEVPIEFKTYYRVEMASATEAEATETPEDAASEPPAPDDTDGQADGADAAVSEDSEQEPVDAAAGPSARHGLFSRS
jgi:hypothetical protein